jgi:hypothetical protein
MTTLYICRLKLHDFHGDKYFCLGKHRFSETTLLILHGVYGQIRLGLRRARLTTGVETKYDATSSDERCESAGQEILHFLRNSKFRRPGSKSGPQTPVQSQMNRVLDL